MLKHALLIKRKRLIRILVLLATLGKKNSIVPNFCFKGESSRITGRNPHSVEGQKS